MMKKKTNILFHPQTNNENTAALYERRFENLVQSMFMDKKWKENYGFTKNIRVLAYCIQYGYINAKQLAMTNLTPHGDRHTENIFLYRLSKKGYLTPIRDETSEYTEYLFLISPAGINFFLKKIQILLGKENPYQIDEKCLQHMCNKVLSFTRRFMKTTKHHHSIAIRSINTYLFSVLPFDGYRFSLETAVNEAGDIVSLHNSSRMTNILVSDAYITTKNHEQRIAFYVEQDMRSQTTSSLKKKVDNYVKCVFQNRLEHPDAHNLLFSLLGTPQTQMRKKTRTKMCSKNSASYRNLLHLLTFFLSNENTPFEDVRMSEVYEELLYYIENAPDVKTHCKNALAYLGDFLKAQPDITAIEFFDLTSKLRSQRKEDEQMILEEQNYGYYASRRKTIHKMLSSVDKSLSRHLLRGISIYTCYTKNPGKVFPYLLPSLLVEKEERLHTVLRYHNLVSERDTVAYAPLSAKNGELVLKNHYKYSNGLHVYVENYSDDYGGKFRIRHYLDTLRWSNDKGILLCLIDDTEQKDLHKFFLKSKYAQVLKETNGKVELPLTVNLLSYSDLDAGKGLFFFGTDLQVHPMESSYQKNLADKQRKVLKEI